VRVRLHVIGVHAAYFLNGPETSVVQIVIIGGDMVGGAHRLVLRPAGSAQVQLCSLRVLVCCCHGLLPFPGAAITCPMALLATVVAFALAAPAVTAFEGAGSSKGLVWSWWYALVLALPLALSQVFHSFDAVSFLAESVDDIRHVEG